MQWRPGKITRAKCIVLYEGQYVASDANQLLKLSAMTCRSCCTTSKSCWTMAIGGKWRLHRT